MFPADHFHLIQGELELFASLGDKGRIGRDHQNELVLLGTSEGDHETSSD